MGSSPSFIGRRKVLAILGVGGALATGEYLRQSRSCAVSPAGCVVSTDAPDPVQAAVSVVHEGETVFAAEPSVTKHKPARYDSVIPIGCLLPEDVTVTVDTDTHDSITRIVTFRQPYSDGEPAGATVGISITPEGIDVEATVHVIQSHGGPI